MGVWMLSGLFLMLPIINIVSGERIQEQIVKSPLCTTDVNPLRNVCYKYDPTERDQPTALAVCESNGGTLAALDNAHTADFVQSRRPNGKVAWIGYHKDYNNQWYDGSVFNWTNWCHNEPNSPVYERCTVMTGGFCWNDGSCGWNAASVCQFLALKIGTQGHAREDTETQAGSVSLPRSEHSAESKFRCGQYCLQDPLCGKFNFQPTTLKCALYDVGAVVNEADGSQTFTL